MTESTTQSPQSPDVELADKIAKAIDSAHLVNTEKLARIREGLHKGNLSSADWKLLVELGGPDEGEADQL